jgi:hypothetical protein
MVLAFGSQLAVPCLLLMYGVAGVEERHVHSHTMHAISCIIHATHHPGHTTQAARVRKNRYIPLLLRCLVISPPPRHHHPCRTPRLHLMNTHPLSYTYNVTTTLQAHRMGAVRPSSNASSRKGTVASFFRTGFYHSRMPSLHVPQFLGVVKPNGRAIQWHAPCGPPPRVPFLLTVAIINPATTLKDLLGQEAPPVLNPDPTLSRSSPLPLPTPNLTVWQQLLHSPL